MRTKVDPETAERWLGYNTRNRNVRPRVVSAYAEAMAAGDWRLDIDPIAFAGTLDGKGKNHPVLLNGQHRLQAIVASGTTLELSVVEGLPIEAQNDMDTGVKRALGDQLRLLGIQYPVDVAAALRLIYAYEHGLLRSRMNEITHATLLRYLADHPDLPDSMKPAKRVYALIGGRGSVYACAHWTFSNLPGPGVLDDVEDFFDKLHSGDGLAPGHPIGAYRRQVIALQNQAGSRRRMDQVHQLALIFKAWNAYRTGHLIHVLSWRGGGKNAESFPVPE
jgi:hypothetical protein